MRELRDRVAVVTGEGSGIGRALALALAREGSQVVLQDLRADRVEAVGAEVAALGPEPLCDAFDVSDREAMQAFADRVRRERGGAHLLVNNAGVSLSGAFLDLSPEEWEWIVGINLWGVIYGCQCFLPQLLAREEGHVVNLSSIFGVIGVPTQSAYCATKFAVRGFTEALSIELAGSAVGTTCVHPGAVNTRIVQDARHHLDAERARRARAILERGMDPDEAARQILAAVRAGRRRLVLGRDARWLDRLARLLPDRYRDLVRRGALRPPRP